MVKPIDAAGMGPSREVTRVDDGYIVKVTPPPWAGFPGASVKLNVDQFSRYNLWRNTNCLIQEVLPDLSDGQREILVSGIGPVEWDAEFKEIDDE